MLFFSPSSLGYIFASAVSLISGIYFYRQWKKTGLATTGYLVKAVIPLGFAHLLWGLPPFFIHENSQLLGLFGIPANILLMMFVAYFGRLSLALSNQEVLGKFFYWFLLIWTLVITIPVNVLYLPLPRFDEYGLEIWNYSWQLFFALSIWVAIVPMMLGITFLRLMSKSNQKLKSIILAIAFILGGLGSVFVVMSTSSIGLVFGYVTMFMGGYWIFILPISLFGKQPEITEKYV